MTFSAWLEFAQNGNWGQVPPPRQLVDANVSAFEALSATEVLVLGSNGNLWYETAPGQGWGTQIPRQQIDGNVLGWALIPQ